MTFIFGITSIAYAKDNLIFQSSKLPVYDNTQTYITEDNETHTIYWAKGVDAPKMLSKGEVANSYDRVFKKREQTENGDKYVEYSYPVESGKGYYDLNKNPERTNIYPQQVNHHCYLAAGLNQLYWWLEQNEAYVNRYIDLISKGVYGQYPGLRPIDNIDNWNRYLTKPIVEYTMPNNYYSMQLSDSVLYREIFKVYHDRDLGYYSDLVWDFFINGYFHYHPKDDGKVAPSNRVELWQPDKDGGLFYNLFGKERLSIRQTVGTYEMFSEVVKKAITSNQGIVINYLSVGKAHAISLWGAEFNEEGYITRVYLTDSDDYNKTDVVENSHAKGLYTNDIVKDNNGNARLTTRVNKNPNSGSVIHELALLSLGQELMDKAFEDISAPIEPKFEQNLSNQVYTTAFDEPIILEVKIKREDKGDYLYQWYEATDSFSEGKPILNGKKSWIRPKIPTDNTAIYYYCVVTNVKNGKMATATSNRAKVYVDKNILHAEKPTITYSKYNKHTYKYTQYEMPKPIKIFGNVGNGNITYQWYHSNSKSTLEGELLVGETSNVFYPNNTAYFEPRGDGTIESHYYYCVVTNTDTAVNGNKQNSTTSNIFEVYVEKEANFAKAMQPVIISNSPEIITEDSFGKLPQLTANAKSLDGGNLIYQWYFSDSLYGSGTKINGANQQTFTPFASNGNKYYYCEIINQNIRANNIYSDKVETIRTEVKTNGLHTASNNAYLQSLTISVGSLSPIFNKNIFDYTINLKYNEEYTIISAVSDFSLATVDGLGKVYLDNGQTKLIKIIVTAEDNITTKTYNITITRDNVPYVPNSDNKLSNLVIDGLNLNPIFNSNIFEYNAIVNYETTKLNIVPILSNSKASFEVIGNVDSLVVGVNKIIVKVTAEDKTIQNYIVNVTRRDKEIVPEPDKPVEPEQGEQNQPQQNPEINKGEDVKSSNLKTWIMATAITAVIIIIVISVIIVVVKKRKI